MHLSLYKRCLKQQQCHRRHTKQNKTKQLTIHAIEGVLLPSNELKAALTAAVAAAAKPSGGNRKMLQFYEVRRA
jgi:hypothetical protein